MALDISTQEAIKRITLDDLINDAVESGDAKRLEYLQKEKKKKVKRAGKDVSNSLSSVRKAYITKYYDYKPKNKKNYEELKSKAEKAVDDKFKEAFERLASSKK